MAVFSSLCKTYDHPSHVGVVYISVKHPVSLCLAYLWCLS